MMTRRRKEFLRNVKMTVVVGAMIFLASGITSIGNDMESKGRPAVRTQAEVSISTAEPEGFGKRTVAVEDEIVPETESEYQSIIYSYDWGAEESNLLCKIAMAEAGNQDTEGKALVMLVVLNRVWGDNEFPDTIEEVIYQPRQFSPVLEGKFEDVVPDQDCWKALEMVEMGWDESQGALYFESKSESTWHEDNLKFLFKHGDHYFYTERD